MQQPAYKTVRDLKAASKAPVVYTGTITIPSTPAHTTMTHAMRSLLLSSLALLLWTAPALAQFDGPGADTMPNTVQALLDNPTDDQSVTLQGRILEQVGHEKYAFSDDTGQIRVEIDNEVFPKQRITPEMTVELFGEVEKDFLRSPEVDVERLTIINTPDEATAQ